MPLQCPIVRLYCTPPEYNSCAIVVVVVVFIYVVVAVVVLVVPVILKSIHKETNYMSDKEFNYLINKIFELIK